ncbi:glycoside hydrolase family protein [Sphingobacterium bambusae]|uniref:Glycoside hydrolase family protein n=1 Tax=Sphingobacterium bambusae TaxID=662858 RepID=A0ABW6BLY2_9SPHI|nr:glycoside hydrolase family protein [Sphingobacterium bambusae]WPL49481.1 glycoside hydrolase family protein [Sphingobacterium bambusae]
MKIKYLVVAPLIILYQVAFAQITERERPQIWSNLVSGARFMDRFLPMKGKVLSDGTWGAPQVKPRFVDNGIEDNIWSYWCGSIQKSDEGKYHMFVCGWLEASPKGHFEWPNSYLFDATSDNLEGPYKLNKMIGKGHNVEAFRLADGRYVLYVIGGRYVAEKIGGPWQYDKFEFDERDRKVVEDMSNLSFARREDGSYLMVNRGGGIWVSKDGLSKYGLLTEKSVYPAVDGEFEDPVIWKDHIQYHLIVNDWLGRIAYYLRSKDGVNWVVDPGEAYAPGIARHADGRSENWFKYERIKIYQDSIGRAIQANLAVVDVQKEEDFASDVHSSKQITIPLNPGLILTVLNNNPINKKTKEIRVKVHAEDGFDPNRDIDLSSLRFGASAEVNFGRGSILLGTQKEGSDLILIFDASGSGITNDEFAPKLIGKYADGKMLFGFARLPYVNYNAPILSARAPIITLEGDKWNSKINVENFGQVLSKKSDVKVIYKKDGVTLFSSWGVIQPISPYSHSEIILKSKGELLQGQEYEVTVSIVESNKIVSKFSFKSTIKD